MLSFLQRRAFISTQQLDFSTFFCRRLNCIFAAQRFWYSLGGFFVDPLQRGSTLCSKMLPMWAQIQLKPSSEVGVQLTLAFGCRFGTGSQRSSAKAKLQSPSSDPCRWIPLWNLLSRQPRAGSGAGVQEWGAEGSSLHPAARIQINCVH